MSNIRNFFIPTKFLIHEMVIFWVYILELKSFQDKESFYIGYTQDLKKRILQHKEGKGARYTRGKQSIKLVYTESYKTRSEAMKREIELKKLNRKDKIELVRNYSPLRL